jgi:hypothetical protein
VPTEARRLLDYARLRVAAAGLGIDTIGREAGMVLLRHHDRRAIERLKAAGPPAARTLRIVDQRTAYLPLDKRLFDDPERLLQALRAVLRPAKGEAYSPRPLRAAAHGPAGREPP